MNHYIAKYDSAGMTAQQIADLLGLRVNVVRKRRKQLRKRDKQVKQLIGGNRNETR